MSDTQILAMVLPIVVALSALIYSNSRVSDAKETLRAEMALGFERVLRETSQIGSVKTEIAGIRADMAALTGKVVEIDNRLTRIEERLEHR